MGLYYSLIDWHNPHYPHYGDLIHPMNDNPAYKDVKHNFQQYVEYMHNQVRELCTNYGTIDMLWFDFSYGDMSGEKREATRLIDMVREYQPDIVIDNRLDNPSNSILSDNPTYFCGDFASPEQLIPPESVRNSKGEEVPWESCITMNNHWGYHRHDRDYKSPKLLIRSLVECVSKGGNLLINVGPDGRGCFPDECLRLLEHVGRWMEKNGDSIYSCGAAKQPKPDIGRLTAKGNKLYFHIFDPVIGPIPLKMNDREKIKRIRFIASGSELSITKDFTAGLYPEYIYMYFGPDPNATYDFPDEIDTVVEIEMKR